MRRPGVGVARRIGFRGIGGGGAAAPAPWTPASLATGTLWLKGGAELTQVAGPKISAWGDSGPVGNDFSQVTDANRPAVSSVNGITCPDFQAGAFRIVGPAGTALLAAASYEFWIVGNFDAFPDSLLFGDSLGAEWIIRTVAGGVQMRHNAGAGLLSTGVIVLTAGVTYAIGVSFDGATVTMRANGTTATVAAGALATRANAAMIGNAVDGRVADVTCSNAILSAGDRTLLTTYLNATYGAVI